MSIIPKEVKSYFRQNKSEISGKFDLDDFDANGETIKVLFDLLSNPRINGYPDGPERFISLKTMLEFSRDIVNTNSEYLNGKDVKNTFYVLLESLWMSEENN